jgi:hypothetical protein
MRSYLVPKEGFAQIVAQKRKTVSHAQKVGIMPKRHKKNVKNVKRALVIMMKGKGSASHVLPAHSQKMKEEPYVLSAKMATFPLKGHQLVQPVHLVLKRPRTTQYVVIARQDNTLQLLPRHRAWIALLVITRWRKPMCVSLARKESSAAVWAAAAVKLVRQGNTPLILGLMVVRLACLVGTPLRTALKNA